MAAVGGRMLDLCGQLLSVAFGLRLLNAQQTTQLGTTTCLLYTSPSPRD